jgi:hypothetical protein
MSYKIGGNRLLYKFGERLVERYKPTAITNPSCRLLNPFTLIVNFTVDNTEKYQIVLQGDYKERYKEVEDGAIDLPEKEMYAIIHDSQKIWFKKE